MKETPLNFYLKDNPMNIISPMLKITEPLTFLGGNLRSCF